MHFLVLNHLTFHKVQVIPGYVRGGIKEAFDIMRDIFYTTSVISISRRIMRVVRIPRTRAGGYSGKGSGPAGQSE